MKVHNSINKLLRYLIQSIGIRHITLSAFSYIFLSILEVACLYLIGFTLKSFLSLENSFLENSNYEFLNDFSNVNKFAIIILFVVIVGAIRIFVQWYNLKLSAITASKLNDKVQNKISNGIVNGYLKIKASDAISILIDQIDRINSCFIQSFFSALGNFITCIFLGTFSIYILPKNAIIPVLILILIYILILYKNKYSLSMIGKNINKSVFTRSSLINFLFEGGREIFLRGDRSAFDIFYKKEERIYRKGMIEAQFLSIYPKYLLETLLICFVIISLYFLNAIPINERNEYFSFLAIFAIVIQRTTPSLQSIFTSISSINSSWIVMQDFKKRIDDIENQYYINKNLRNKSESSIIKKYNSIKKINYNQGLLIYKTEFVREIENYSLVIDDLRIENRKKILIRGKSGIGKSTLIDLIIGRIKPKKGIIHLNNLPLELNDICICEQKPVIFKGSIFDNIFFNAPYKNNKKIYKNIEDVKKMLNYLNFAPYDISNKKIDYKNFQLQDSGINISGGQIKRIGIIRALINKNKKIYIFDESTGGLDSETELKAIKLISEKCSNAIIIFISHSESYYSLFDQIYELYSSKGIVKLRSYNEI